MADFVVVVGVFVFLFLVGCLVCFWLGVFCFGFVLFCFVLVAEVLKVNLLFYTEDEKLFLRNLCTVQ